MTRRKPVSVLRGRCRFHLPQDANVFGTQGGAPGTLAGVSWHSGAGSLAFWGRQSPPSHPAGQPRWRALFPTFTTAGKILINIIGNVKTTKDNK
ncbi:MAG TPA: hypothetical protein VGZ25_00725 [Gemmataceae bacterium]|nr:hypothetical protein [Gemmataceae bacterium]